MRDAVVEIARDLTYILERGAEGSHLLFTPDDIRHAFGASGAHVPVLDAEVADEGELLVRSVAAASTLEERAALVEAMTPRERSLLIRRYFEVLDDFAASHGVRLH